MSKDPGPQDYLTILHRNLELRERVVEALRSADSVDGLVSEVQEMGAPVYLIPYSRFLEHEPLFFSSLSDGKCYRSNSNNYRSERGWHYTHDAHRVEADVFYIAQDKNTREVHRVVVYNPESAQALIAQLEQALLREE